MKTIGLSYIRFLTDDFGIWQHSKGENIDRKHGYALDDAARALLVALRFEAFDLAEVYFTFLEHACCDFPVPVNFFDARRQPRDLPVSPDALGESYWAIAACIDADFQIERAEKIRAWLTLHLSRTDSPRAMAYTLIGAAHIDKQLALHLADQLLALHKRNSRPDWTWLEDVVAYGNAIIPLALLIASEELHEEKYAIEALGMLDFLNRLCRDKDIPIAIGNKGWHPYGKEKALYSQQPIDPAYQVLANAKAYALTKDTRYFREVETYMSWFQGNNTLGKPVINTKRECCYDGLEPKSVSANAGAESTVCYLLAQYATQNVPR